MESSIVTSLIAAGSATGGIMLKMAYDGIVEHLKLRHEDERLFITERKDAYDEFLLANKALVRYQARLQELSLIARAGKQVKPEVLEEFPDSPMSDLVDALEKIRRIAKNHDVIKIAERVVQLRGDASAALRLYATKDDLSYGLPFFLVSRFGEDQILEFIAAYRKDLGLGAPKGANENFPIIDRNGPTPIVESERYLRTYLKPYSAQNQSLSWPETGIGKPLTAEDAQLLETPKFRAMIVSVPPMRPGG